MDELKQLKQEVNFNEQNNNQQCAGFPTRDDEQKQGAGFLTRDFASHFRG